MRYFSGMDALASEALGVGAEGFFISGAFVAAAGGCLPSMQVFESDGLNSQILRQESLPSDDGTEIKKIANAATIPGAVTAAAFGRFSMLASRVISSFMLVAVRAMKCLFLQTLPL